AMGIIGDQDAIAHYDMRFVKPLDEEMLHEVFESYNQIVTLEDGSINGGFGSAVLEFASQNDYKNTIRVQGVPDQFIDHGSIDELRSQIDLDVKNLVDLLRVSLEACRQL
ncbi:MAG: hypothetical protein HRU26_09665, partial [Psychroserpens sp.]|nr:hypothetical protein [Psychroserpens sp.]